MSRTPIHLPEGEPLAMIGMERNLYEATARSPGPAENTGLNPSFLRQKVASLARPGLRGGARWCEMTLRTPVCTWTQALLFRVLMRTATAGILIGSLSIARAQPVVSSFPGDHHEVYASFFQYHLSWQQWATAQAAANSAKAAQLTGDFAALLKIDAKESAVVSAASGKVAADLAALDSQRSAYLQDNKANPYPHALDQFAVRRQQIIMSGVTALMRGLTKRSWVGLHTYINWDDRVNGTVIALGRS